AQFPVQSEFNWNFEHDCPVIDADSFAALVIQREMFDFNRSSSRFVRVEEFALDYIAHSPFLENLCIHLTGFIIHLESKTGSVSANELTLDTAGIRFRLRRVDVISNSISCFIVVATSSKYASVMRVLSM
ncbi:hypothetical protein PENTCL1PPCAC_14669, partial [Pristionchus entomophagus]